MDTKIVHATLYYNDKKPIFTHFSVRELVEEDLELDFRRKILVLNNKKDIRSIVKLYSCD